MKISIENCNPCLNDNDKNTNDAFICKKSGSCEVRDENNRKELKPSETNGIINNKIEMLRKKRDSKLSQLNNKINKHDDQVEVMRENMLTMTETLFKVKEELDIAREQLENKIKCMNTNDENYKSEMKKAQKQYRDACRTYESRIIQLEGKHSGCNGELKDPLRSKLATNIALLSHDDHNENNRGVSLSLLLQLRTASAISSIKTSTTKTRYEIILYFLLSLAVLSMISTITIGYHTHLFFSASTIRTKDLLCAPVPPGKTFYPNRSEMALEAPWWIPSYYNWKETAYEYLSCSGPDGEMPSNRIRLDWISNSRKRDGKLILSTVQPASTVSDGGDSTRSITKNKDKHNKSTNKTNVIWSQRATSIQVQIDTLKLIHRNNFMNIFSSSSSSSFKYIQQPWLIP